MTNELKGDIDYLARFIEREKQEQLFVSVFGVPRSDYMLFDTSKPEEFSDIITKDVYLEFKRYGLNACEKLAKDNSDVNLALYEGNICYATDMAVNNYISNRLQSERNKKDQTISDGKDISRGVGLLGLALTFIAPPVGLAVFSASCFAEVGVGAAKYDKVYCPDGLKNAEKLYDYVHPRHIRHPLYGAYILSDKTGSFSDL
jgi:hypothetical protein